MIMPSRYRRRIEHVRIGMGTQIILLTPFAPAEAEVEVDACWISNMGTNLYDPDIPKIIVSQFPMPSSGILS